MSSGTGRLATGECRSLVKVCPSAMSAECLLCLRQRPNNGLRATSVQGPSAEVESKRLVNARHSLICVNVGCERAAKRLRSMRILVLATTKVIDRWTIGTCANKTMSAR